MINLHLITTCRLCCIHSVLTVRVSGVFVSYPSGFGQSAVPELLACRL